MFLYEDVWLTSNQQRVQEDTNQPGSRSSPSCCPHIKQQIVIHVKQCWLNKSHSSSISVRLWSRLRHRGFAETFSLFATRLTLSLCLTDRCDGGINWYFKVQDALRGTCVSDRGINELIWLLPSTFQMKERLINIDVVVPKRPINCRMTSVLHPSVPSPCCCSSTLSLVNTASCFSATFTLYLLVIDLQMKAAVVQHVPESLTGLTVCCWMGRVLVSHSIKKKQTAAAEKTLLRKSSEVCLSRWDGTNVVLTSDPDSSETQEGQLCLNTKNYRLQKIREEENETHQLHVRTSQNGCCTCFSPCENLHKCTISSTEDFRLADDLELRWWANLPSSLAQHLNSPLLVQHLQKCEHVHQPQLQFSACYHTAAC